MLAVLDECRLCNIDGPGCGDSIRLHWIHCTEVSEEIRQTSALVGRVFKDSMGRWAHVKEQRSQDTRGSWRSPSWWSQDTGAWDNGAWDTGAWDSGA